MASRPPPRLAYFGQPGSFSQLAAQKRFPKADLVSSPTVEQAFALLQAGDFSQIVVPIENGSSGIITNTADQLMRLAKSAAGAGLQIREALAMRVELALMARADAGAIQKIYSHRAPFDHGRDWLQKHYPQAEQVIVESTSEAAALASKEKGTAAIAGQQAVAQHGLKIISREVGAEVANQTTFIVVGATIPRSPGATHTSQPRRGASCPLPPPNQPHQNPLPPHPRPLRGIPFHDRDSRCGRHPAGRGSTRPPQENHHVPRRHRQLSRAENLTWLPATPRPQHPLHLGPYIVSWSRGEN
jgi:prephenate dehydratase